ncbi:MAG: diguanylate cyclase [Ruminococcaceae bacterium]|nr:diguanylate cyclase [Oscillospiraceae bacterium]
MGRYNAAVEAEEGVWMQPYRDPQSGNMLISFVSPFYCEDILAGMLGIDVNFSYLVQYIDSIAVYENGRALLREASSGNIYNSEENSLESAANNPFTMASAPLHNGMTLELRAEYRDIQRNIHPMLTRIVLAFIVVSVFFIICTIIVTRKITAPLKKLTAAAKDIANGKENVDLTMDSDDEIGTLAKVLSNTYSKLIEYTKYVNALAYRDSLTGVKNRTAYDEAAKGMDGKIEGGETAFAVLVADINGLKQTNDRFGHDKGNELIVHATRNICDAFKHSPVFRIGGDEFVVIMEGRDFENRESLLSAMDEACRDDVITAGEGSIPVSVARGIAVFEPETDKGFADVFNRADREMYINKEAIKGLSV